MADVQKYFAQFHLAIMLTDLDQNTTLREKRDILTGKLRAGLKKKFEESEHSTPTFQDENLGSYAMSTGIKPVGDRDYDIDVGLFFNLSAEDIEPVELKSWVHEILNVHPHTAEIRRPCVTVWYKEKGEIAYHVDFAVFSAGDANKDRTPRLAQGFVGSSNDKKTWQRCKPLKIRNKLRDRHSGEDRDQYRRVIRYLKRWKDNNFKPSGESAPKGIGLHTAAYEWFSPVRPFDPRKNKRVPDDLSALIGLVESMLSSFQVVWFDNEYARRLRTPLPDLPWEDPWERMSNKQMDAFKTTLQALSEALQEAKDSVDPVESCTKLQAVFGDDFPIPDKPSTGGGGSKGKRKSPPVLRDTRFG